MPFVPLSIFNMSTFDSSNHSLMRPSFIQALRGGADRSLQMEDTCELIDADVVEYGQTICDFLQLLIGFGGSNNGGKSIFDKCCTNLSGDEAPECCLCEMDNQNVIGKKLKPDGTCPGGEGGASIPKGLVAQFLG